MVEHALPNLNSTNMISSSDFNNHPKTSTIEHMDTECHQVGEILFYRPKAQLFLPKHRKLHLLQLDSYHCGTNDGLVQHRTIWLSLDKDRSHLSYHHYSYNCSDTRTLRSSLTVHHKVLVETFGNFAEVFCIWRIVHSILTDGNYHLIKCDSVVCMLSHTQSGKVFFELVDPHYQYILRSELFPDCH